MLGGNRLLGRLIRHSWELCLALLHGSLLISGDGRMRSAFLFAHLGSGRRVSLVILAGSAAFTVCGVLKLRLNSVGKTLTVNAVVLAFLFLEHRFLAVGQLRENGSLGIAVIRSNGTAVRLCKPGAVPAGIVSGFTRGANFLVCFLFASRLVMLIQRVLADLHAAAESAGEESTESVKRGLTEEFFQDLALRIFAAHALRNKRVDLAFDLASVVRQLGRNHVTESVDDVRERFFAAFGKALLERVSEQFLDTVAGRSFQQRFKAELLADDLSAAGSERVEHRLIRRHAHLNSLVKRRVCRLPEESKQSGGLAGHIAKRSALRSRNDELVHVAEALAAEETSAVRKHTILGLSTRLEQAYYLKNDFLFLMHSPNSEIAEELLGDWILRAESAHLPEFYAFLLLLAIVQMRVIGKNYLIDFRQKQYGAARSVKRALFAKQYWILHAGSATMSPG